MLVSVKKYLLVDMYVEQSVLGPAQSILLSVLNSHQWKRGHQRKDLLNLYSALFT